jgi:hypothetical protein
MHDLTRQPAFMRPLYPARARTFNPENQENHTARHTAAELTLTHPRTNALMNFSTPPSTERNHEKKERRRLTEAGGKKIAC